MWFEDYVFEKECRGHCSVRSSDDSWSACIGFKHDNFTSLVAFMLENRTHRRGRFIEFYDIDLLRYIAGILENLSNFSISFVFHTRSRFPIYLYPNVLEGLDYCALIFDGIHCSTRELSTLADWQLCKRVKRSVLIRNTRFIFRILKKYIHFAQVGESDFELTKYIDKLLDINIADADTAPEMELRTKNEAFPYFEHLLKSPKWKGWAIRTNSTCLRSIKLLSDRFDETRSVVTLGEDILGTRPPVVNPLPENQKRILFMCNSDFGKGSGIPRRLGRAFTLFKFSLLNLRIQFTDYIGFIENLNNLVRGKYVPQLLFLEILDVKLGNMEQTMTTSNIGAYLSLVLRLLAACKSCAGVFLGDNVLPNSVEFPSSFFSVLYDLDHVRCWRMQKKLPNLEAKTQRMGELDMTALYNASRNSFSKMPKIALN